MAVVDKVVNKWVEHIRKYAKDNKVSYGCALGMPECRASYKSKKDLKKEAEPKKEEKKEEPKQEPIITGPELLKDYLKKIDVYVDRYGEQQVKAIFDKFKSKAAFKDFMIQYTNSVEKETSAINNMRTLLESDKYPKILDSLTGDNKREVVRFQKFSKNLNRRITGYMNKIKKP